MYKLMYSTPYNNKINYTKLLHIHSYVMDIAEDKFCNRRELYMKYKPQVFDMCNLLVNVGIGTLYGHVAI